MIYRIIMNNNQFKVILANAKEYDTKHKSVYSFQLFVFINFLTN